MTSWCSKQGAEVALPNKAGIRVSRRKHIIFQGALPLPSVPSSQAHLWSDSSPTSVLTCTACYCSSLQDAQGLPFYILNKFLYRAQGLRFCTHPLTQKFLDWGTKKPAYDTSGFRWLHSFNQMLWKTLLEILILCHVYVCAMFSGSLKNHPFVSLTGKLAQTDKRDRFKEASVSTPLLHPSVEEHWSFLWHYNPTLGQDCDGNSQRRKQ